MKKIKKAVFAIGGTKALGVDGMPAIFFQRIWDVSLIIFINNQLGQKLDISLKYQTIMLI